MGEDPHGQPGYDPLHNGDPAGRSSTPISSPSSRSTLLALGLVGIAALAAWWFAVSQPRWQEQAGAMNPPDMAFTTVPLVIFVAGVIAGIGGRGWAGWIGAAGGLVIGSVIAAVIWGEAKVVQPGVLLIELGPLTLGYAIGRLLPDASRRFELVLACAVGLWLPFAALAVFGVLWILSPPGLGERDWPAFTVALLVATLVPIGLVLVRSERTRLPGRLLLGAVGWGVAAWALVLGFGEPLWEAPGAVSAPGVGVLLAAVILGVFLGVAVAIDRPVVSPAGAATSRTPRPGSRG